MNTPFFCRRCGNQLFEQENFCPYCGAPLEAETPPPVETPPVFGGAVQPEPEIPAFTEEYAQPAEPAQPETPAFTGEYAQPAEPAQPVGNVFSSPAAGDPGDATQPFSAPLYAEDATQAVRRSPYADNAQQPFPTPPYTEPAEQPAPPRKPRAEKKKVGALRVVGSSFLCLLAVLFGLSSCLIFVLRSATSPDAFEAVLEDVEISEIAIPAEDGGTQLLSEYIVDQIPESTREKYQLNVNNIEKLMNRTFIREFLETKLGEVAGNFYSGSEDSFLTPRELKSFLRKNSPEIARVTGYSLSENDLNQIGSYLEKNKALENITFSELSMPRLQDEYPFLSAVPMLTSYVTASLLAVLAVILLVLAAWVSRFRAFSLVYVTVTCLFVGSVHLTIAFLTNTLAGVLHNLYPLQKFFYAQLLSPLRSACFHIGLPLIGVGILCICVLLIVRAIGKKQRDAVSTAPAAM